MSPTPKYDTFAVGCGAILNVDPLPDITASNEISNDLSELASLVASDPSTTTILIVSVLVPETLGVLAKTTSNVGSTNDVSLIKPLLMFVRSISI